VSGGVVLSIGVGHEAAGPDDGRHPAASVTGCGHSGEAGEWFATVQDRALTRVQAEAVAEGTQFSDAQLELIVIGILASASEMLTLLDELGLRRRPG
jgi:hypothetical protein